MNRKSFLGHTWLGWLNIVVLSWFFIRLAEIIDSDTMNHIGWKIIFPISPFSNYTK
jgi:hypothetical protein